MLYLFKVRELGAFLAHGRQYRRMGLVYFVTSYQCSIHARNKHKKRAFFLHIIPNSRIVFGCNNKSDSENGRALHKIPFFNDHRPEWVKRRKNGSILQSLAVYACMFVVASQSKLDPFSFIVVHGPKKRPTTLLWTSEGKVQGQKRFRQSKQGSSESLFMRKINYLGFSFTLKTSFIFKNNYGMIVISNLETTIVYYWREKYVDENAKKTGKKIVNNQEPISWSMQLPY